MKHPIDLPSELTSDRAVKRLVTAWIHAHARFNVCRKRINWNNAKARIIEKKRRKEKWQCVARILEIERTLIRWAATATHHPDIWMSRKENAPLSTLRMLEGEYYRNRQIYHGATGERRVKGLQERARIVTAIRTIIRAWMLEYCAIVAPKDHVPNPLPLHPRELLPRKLARASKELLAEVA
jgi:hypothetical protein